MAAITELLNYVTELKKVGVPAEQADVHAKNLASLIENNLATKQDIDSLKLATKQDIDSLKLATKQDIDSLRLATKQDIDNLKLVTKQDIECLKLNVEGLKKDIVNVEQKLETKINAVDTKLAWLLAIVGFMAVGLPLFGTIKDYVTAMLHLA